MADYISKKNIKDSLVLIRSCDYESALSIIDNMSTADVQPVDRWISVEDRLPNQDEKVLVLTKDRDIMTMIYKVTSFRWYKPNFGGFDKDFVMYWQPFPELPKDGDTI